MIVIDQIKQRRKAQSNFISSKQITKTFNLLTKDLKILEDKLLMLNQERIKR